MIQRALPFTALTFACLLFAGTMVPAQDVATAPDVPAISTSACPDYPEVTCTSADPLACIDALQLATDTRDHLAPLLKLGPKWRFAVHLHVLTPTDPLTAKIDHEAAAVFAQGSTMKIEAVIPVGDTNPREFIERQYVVALLWEKFFASTTTFNKDTHLDVVPMWLVEGVRESLHEDADHDREKIVRRAVQDQMSPTLEEVTNWHELSTDRLLGLWQRAFSYYLVDSLTRGNSRREDFQQWLEGFSNPNPSTAQYHFPTEADWQKELVDATSRSHDIVYTWSESQTEMANAATITYTNSKTAKDVKVQTCSIDMAPTLPRNKDILDALQAKIFSLTELELRAHPGWNPILELYRSALTAIVQDNKPEVAKLLLQEAHRRQVAEIDYHQKLLDYANWFEVTKDYDDNSTRFTSYFETEKEMERVEADPKNPNPIRANLLSIESQL
jgi:hypothetical protein